MQFHLASDRDDEENHTDMERRTCLFVLTAAGLFLGVLSALGQQANGPYENGQYEGTVDLAGTELGERVETTLSVAFAQVYNDLVLAWNEHGYVELKNLHGYRYLAHRPNGLIRVRGTVIRTGPLPRISVEEITDLQEKVPHPPFVPAPERIEKQPEEVLHTRLKGTVEQVLDMEDYLILRMSVGSDTVHYQLCFNNQLLRNVPRAGQVLAFNGFLWQTDNAHRKEETYMMAEKPWCYSIIKKSAVPRAMPFDPGKFRETDHPFYISNVVYAGEVSGFENQGMFIERHNGRFSVQIPLDELPSLGIPKHKLEPDYIYDLTGSLERLAENSYRLKPQRIHSNQNRRLRKVSEKLSRKKLTIGLPLGLPVKARGRVSQLEPLELTLEEGDVVRVTNASETLKKAGVQRNDLITIKGSFLGAGEIHYSVRSDSPKDSPKDSTEDSTEDSPKDSTADLDLVRNPMKRNILLFLGVVGMGSFLAAIWIFSLRRLVRERTAELSTSRSNLAAVYDSVPEGFLAVTTTGEIFNTNEHFNDWFTEHALVGNTEQAAIEKIARRFRDQEAWKQFVASPPEERRQGIELEADLPEMGTRVLDVRVLPIEHPQAESGRLWVFRDVSDQRQLQQSMIQASKLEAIGRLTGGIAHDFNNLLTAVTGNLSLLEMDLDDPEQRELIQHANMGAMRASELVKQLLDYTKQTRLELKVCSVNDILIDLHDLLRHGMDARQIFVFDLADDLRACHVDPLKIEQVLMNLIINATDAMPEGGRVSVTTRNTTEAPAGSELPPIEIIVEDSGTGMSEELQRQIFEPFFTTKGDRGTGLGLATSLGIVEQHGGTIRCRSEIGTGTRFEILLPACSASVQRPPDRAIAQKTPAPPPNALPAIHGETRTKILVVDDEPAVRLLIRSILQRHNYDVVCFQNGEEATGYLREHPHAVDLVVCDNSMPRMDGVLTYQFVRDQFPSLPFILVSGYLIDLDNYAAVANGEKPEGMLQKPLSVAPLMNMVNEVLAASNHTTNP